MKKITYLLLFLLALLAQPIFSQNKCIAPQPTVVTTTVNAALISWESTNATAYYVEVYKEGSTIALQKFETTNTYTWINNLEAGKIYLAKVSSICPSGYSNPNIIRVQPLIIEDNLCSLLIIPNPYIKLVCKNLVTNLCLNKGSLAGDLMRYGGDIFSVTTPSGHSYEWSCVTDGSELYFRNRASGNRNVITDPIYSSNSANRTIIGFHFKDAQNPNTILWSLYEIRRRSQPPTFYLIFKVAACLNIEKCEFQAVTPKEPCIIAPDLCVNKGSNLEGQSPQIENNLSVIPNPIADVANISLTISAPTEASVNVYDLSGKLIETLHTGRIESGIHKFAWQSPLILRGVYFIELRTPTQRVLKKMVKL